MIRRRPLPVLALLLVAVLAACGSLTEPAATVDGTEISEQDLRDELAAATEFEELNPGLTPYATDEAGNWTLGSASNLLQGLIEDQILTDLLDDIGGEVTEADTAEAELILEGVQVTPWAERFVERRARVLAVQRELAEQAGVPATVEEWFEANGEQFADLVCSRHVLLDTEEDAVAARERIVGGDDFGVVAAELSVGPTGPDGGDLGCTIPEQFIPEFAELITTIEVGEISGPLQTQFGWHVVQVTSRPPGLADVFEEATAAFQNDTNQAIESALFEALSAADVEVSSRYGTWTGTRLAAP